jgi:D-alanyl-D-alanine carboxypeptidase
MQIKHTSTISLFLALLLLTGCGGNPEPSTTTSSEQAEQATSAISIETTSPEAPIQVKTFVRSSEYLPFPDDLQTAFQAAIDKEFSSTAEKAGISAAVYTNGMIWTYATGKADETNKMIADTPMFISSTSKTFLSALVLTQIEKGLYQATDTLGVVLADHHAFSSFDTSKISHDVTIHELLTMTSGLPNFNDNSEGVGGVFKKSSWKPSDNINLVQSPFTKPGTFDYNDTNVVLLGMVAELHEGKTLATLYRETFFEPLGIMAITLPEEGFPWHPEIFSDPGDQFTKPKMAMPYAKLPGGSGDFGNTIEAAPYSFGYYIMGQGRIRWACCSIVSTAENVAIWAYQLYSNDGSAIPDSARTLLLNSFIETSVPRWSNKDQYGYFAAKRTLSLADTESITAYGHPGGGSGYSSLMRYSPELDLSVTILANADSKRNTTCVREKPTNCMAVSIFETYSNFVKGKGASK